ncbi:MAG: GTP-binding protein [Gammaproteobacteria bacterium]|nr:GTP-binding protein [Gammaproteobacteria bacterium]
MQLDRIIRWVLTLGILLLAVIVLGVVLYLTDSFLSVWDRLLKAPRALLVVYFSALGFFLLGTAWLVWKLVVPSRHAQLAKRQEQPTEQGVESRLASSAQAGVDTAQAQAEMHKLLERRARGGLYIAFYGEISSGKSSLISAFIRASNPEADIEISVRGGSTRQVREYESPQFPGWVFADVPGLNEADGASEVLATDEARRAHLVVYVCDGDLTRVDYAHVERLVVLDKPLIIALNKSDLLSPADVRVITLKIRERLEPLHADGKIESSLHVVAVSAATTEEVIRVMPDGNEQRIERAVPPNISALKNLIDDYLDGDAQKLTRLRDGAVFALASDKLDQAEAVYRQNQAQLLVHGYTKKAVIGALAAVAPGTDLVIQGVLATTLTREMCALYNAPVKDLDVQKFLKQTQRHVGKAVPIVLAVAGNALKAFPGVGTVAGGLAHAVAYGLIFDALGRSLAFTLAEGHGFQARDATRAFRESLDNDLETRTKRIAKLVLALRKNPE